MFCLPTTAHCLVPSLVGSTSMATVCPVGCACHDELCVCPFATALPCKVRRVQQWEWLVDMETWIELTQRFGAPCSTTQLEPWTRTVSLGTDLDRFGVPCITLEFAVKGARWRLNETWGAYIIYIDMYMYSYIVIDTGVKLPDVQVGRTDIARVMQVAYTLE